MPIPVLSSIVFAAAGGAHTHLIEALAAAGVVVWTLVRQLQARPLSSRLSLGLPLVLAALGIVLLARFSIGGSGLSSTDLAWIGVDLAAAVVTAIIRAPSIRLFERDGVTWRQGTPITLALWLVSIGVRVVIDVIGGHHGAGATLEHSLPLSFGLTLAVQQALLSRRANRTTAARFRSRPQKRKPAQQRERTQQREPTQQRSPASTGGAIAALGAWAGRHAKLVVALWFVLLVAATIGHRSIGSSYSDTLTIPGSTAQQGLDLLQSDDPRAGGQEGQVVFSSSSGSLASHRQAIEQTRKKLEQLPDVLQVSDPLAPATVSPNGRAAYAHINFSKNPQALKNSFQTDVHRATAPATNAGVQVSYGGALGQALEPKADDARSELIGIGVAVAVLLIGFGSVLAAGVPLLSAILAVISGIGVLGMLSSAISFGTSSPTLATMMGLGVGIDYALFFTTRYRQRLADGNTPEVALRATQASSGRAVLVAAVTVILAMLGLYASGISFIGKLGLAATITVAAAALAALTLVPALVTLAGKRIDRFAVRRPVAEPPATGGRLHGYIDALGRHPLRYALGGIALLLVIAIPTVSLQMSHVWPGSQPKSFTERQAYDAIGRDFGAGANGPLTIVVDAAGTSAAQRSELSRKLESALHSTNDVASVTPFRPSDKGGLLIAKVTPDSGPNEAATQTLIDHLQDQTLPRELHGTGAKGYVSGQTATELDFQRAVASHLPTIIAVVIAAAFLLLLLAFRSPLLALKAALLNLLSIGASYGVLVAVFQWGWGAKILGLPGAVPIESYVPMIIFAIVFGLSMDYEVFLLSRVREHWQASGDNRASVAAGLSQTARVISCAAIVMASVFFAFLLTTNVVVKMLALGLGVSVIIDATVIRLLIVPSLMFLFGRAAWWTPRWLDRILPGDAERPAAHPERPALGATPEPGTAL